ncbi:hypothetical protein AMTR_s00006p00132260 [Amborella trichopoda]|uniref:Uncharacterized protein n=1 Tax=Amborella trichopoda TaxID=13333 RepID=W1PCH9_AMBTC|nr:hypothetical protein AMTR_s00006p00132260 [Amborella trichopoda]
MGTLANPLPDNGKKGENEPPEEAGPSKVVIMMIEDKLSKGDSNFKTVKKPKTSPRFPLGITLLKDNGDIGSQNLCINMILINQHYTPSQDDEAENLDNVRPDIIIMANKRWNYGLSSPCVQCLHYSESQWE